jgi:ABC-2 type transport system ATP-binding protein
MGCIEIRNVTKQFGATTAVKDVSVTLGGNRIYGLLGRNGAGKTTLLNMITNKLFPTAGEIFIDGENVYENDKALSKVYCMGESRMYPDTMRIKEVFKWTKEFYPDMDTDYAVRLAEKFGLNLKKKVRELSTGYKSIFQIIIALSSGAPVLLLDEPVLGLDANFRDLFYRELLESYNNKPRTIVISTHLIEEAADVIENVIIIKNGEVLLQDEAEHLLSMGYTVTGPQRLVDEFTHGRNIIGADTLGGIKSVYMLEKLDKDTVPEGVEVSGMKLQNLFIHLTNS